MAECDCSACGERLIDTFRYCPSCGAAQRTRLVEFFPAHPDVPGSAAALRVSRYLECGPGKTHTRFSVRSPDGRALAAVSLDAEESDRLARFLTPASGATSRRRSPWSWRRARGANAFADPVDRDRVRADPTR